MLTVDPRARGGGRGAPERRARARGAPEAARRARRGRAWRGRRSSSTSCARPASSTPAARACSRSSAASQRRSPASRCRRAPPRRARGRRRGDPPGALALPLLHGLRGRGRGPRRRRARGRARAARRLAARGRRRERAEGARPHRRPRRGARARDARRRRRAGRDREHAPADGRARGAAPRAFPTTCRADDRRVVAVVAGAGEPPPLRELRRHPRDRRRPDDEPVDGRDRRRDRATAATEVDRAAEQLERDPQRRAGARARATSPSASFRRARSGRARRDGRVPSRRSTRRRTRPRCARRSSTVATGEVTLASRDAELDGVAVREGAWLGLADGDASPPVADFDEVARAVAERLLGEPREVLTLLTGEEEPELEALLERVRRAAPRRRARGARGRPAPLPAAPLGGVGRTVAAWWPARCHSRPARRGQRRLPRGARAPARAPGRTSRSSARRRRGTRRSRPAASMTRRRADGLPAARARRRRRRRSAVTRGLPGRRRRLPDRVGEPARGRRALRGAGAVRLPLEGPGARGDRRGDPQGRRSSTGEAHGENTAIVLDSTADFPDAPIALPEHARRPALRPLRRGELPRLRRARPVRLLRAPAHADGPAHDVAADAAGLPLGLRGALAATSGSTRSISPSKLSGTFAERALAADGARRRPGPRVDSEPASVGDRDARARDPAPARARDDRRGDRRACSRATASDARLLFTVDTLEYLAKGGRIGRAGAGRQLLNVKPILAIETARSCR